MLFKDKDLIWTGNGQICPNSLSNIEQLNDLIQSDKTKENYVFEIPKVVDDDNAYFIILPEPFISNDNTQ